MCLTLGIAPALAQATNPSSTSTNGSSAYNSSSSSSTSDSTTSEGKLKHSDKKFLTKVAEGDQLEIALAQLAIERASNPDVRAYAQQLASDHLALSQQLTQLAETKGIAADVAEYAPNTTAADLNTAATTTTPTRSGLASNSATGSTSATATASATYPNPNAAGAPTGRMTASSESNEKWNDPTKTHAYKKLAAKNGADFDKEYISMMVSDHEEDIEMFNKEAQSTKDDADVRSFASSTLPKLEEHLQKAQQLASTTKS